MGSGGLSWSFAGEEFRLNLGKEIGEGELGERVASALGERTLAGTLGGFMGRGKLKRCSWGADAGVGPSGVCLVPVSENADGTRETFGSGGEVDGMGTGGVIEAQD